MKRKQHKLTSAQQRDSRWTGECSCRAWVGVGDRKRDRLIEAHATHIRQSRQAGR